MKVNFRFCVAVFCSILTVILCLAFFPSPTKQIEEAEKKMKKNDRISLVATGEKKGDAEYRIAQDAETGEYHVTLVRHLQSGEYEILEDLGTIE